MIRGVGERRAHRIAGGNRGRREWMWNMELGWERIGAGGMQHSNNGAVLGATGGAGRGRRVPGPSPALFLSYTNSPASTPSAEPKGPISQHPITAPMRLVIFACALSCAAATPANQTLFKPFAAMTAAGGNCTGGSLPVGVSCNNFRQIPSPVSLLLLSQ